jgi:ribosomal protein S11
LHLSKYLAYLKVGAYQPLLLIDKPLPTIRRNDKQLNKGKARLIHRKEIKMKTTLLIIFIAIFGITHAQTPSFQWAKSAGGTNNDEANSITTDANGNVYITGRFQSPTITFGITTLTKVGAFDFFITKYDANGNVVWAKSAGGANDDVGQSITTDNNGNVYVTGYFYSPTITFGTTTLTNSSNADDIFLVKYDANGNVLWAKSEGGTGYEDGKSIATDPNGNVFLTGNFSSSSITFGTTTLTNFTAPAGEIFVTKYDSSGNVLWAKISGESPLTEKVSSIAVDTNGNAYITGHFNHTTVTFGSYNLTISDSTGANLFLVKYDGSGNVLWAKIEGGTRDDIGKSLSTDLNGNVFLTGFFKSPSIIFGATTLNNVGTSTGSLNIFVVKYDELGNTIWAKGIGDSEAELSHSIITDASGNTYVTGQFESSSISFGTNTITKTGSTYYSDIFVVKYDPNGNDLWAVGVGGSDNETGLGIATNTNQDVFLTGYFFSSSINFGATTLTNTGGSVFTTKLGNGTTDIIDISNNLTIQLYPNPTSSSITIQANEILKDATLSIYTTVGQKVKKIKNISGKSVLLSLDNLTNGQYIIELQMENKVFKDKLIIVNQ